MKPLLLFLLLSTAAWGQDSSTTKIFRDVYGNWYDSKGVVETMIVKHPEIKFDSDISFPRETRYVEFTGFLDINLFGFVSISGNNLNRHRANIEINGRKYPLKTKQVGKDVFVLINNKWIEL